jgi:YtkA-like
MMSFRRRLGRRLACHNLLAFITALLLLAGCSRSTNSLGQLTVEGDVTPKPAHVGPTTIDFKVRDGSGSPVSGARAKVEATMTHPGMAPTFAEAKEVAPGMYRCPIEFSMAGDWVIIINITLSDGRELERSFEVRGVR